jgi:hypothetical protein
MRRKSIRTNTPTLASMAIIYKNRGFKRPKGCARVYMNGYNDAKIRYKMIVKKIAK